MQHVHAHMHTQPGNACAMLVMRSTAQHRSIGDIEKVNQRGGHKVNDGLLLGFVFSKLDYGYELNVF